MADERPLPGVLKAVKEQAALRDRSKREAHDGLIAAMWLARAHGYTLQDVGEAAGVTRQACWEMLGRRSHHHP